jgi:hypothetical protein
MDEIDQILAEVEVLIKTCKTIEEERDRERILLFIVLLFSVALAVRSYRRDPGFRSREVHGEDLLLACYAAALGQYYFS